MLGLIDDFSTMKWGELLQASGGRKIGTNHHDLLLQDLTTNAQNRLKIIISKFNQDFNDEYDAVYQFRGNYV